MLQPKEYYGSIRSSLLVIIGILAGGTGLIWFATEQRQEEEGKLVLALIMIVLAMALVRHLFLIWRRLRNPLLSFDGGVLTINPTGGDHDEYRVPLSRLRSIAVSGYEISERDQDPFMALTVTLFASGSPEPTWLVDAIFIETIDARIVQPLQLKLFKPGEREEIRALVLMLRKGGGQGSEAQILTNSADLQRVLVAAPGETRDHMLSRLEGHSIESHPTEGENGTVITAADVEQWGLDGYLYAEFDRHDLLHTITWKPDPSIEITESMIRKILVQLEERYGCSVNGNDLNWNRADNGIERMLEVIGIDDESFEIRYTEQSSDRS